MGYTILTEALKALLDLTTLRQRGKAQQSTDSQFDKLT
jgi:hypothetical protein